MPVAAQAATYDVWAGTPRTAHVPGAFVQGLYDSDSYYPGTASPLRIRQGDTVRFLGDFHTATILGRGNRSRLELVQPDPTHGVYGTTTDAANAPFYFSGMPKFIYNPATFSPIGPRVVGSKTATYSSGALFLSRKGYSLRFARAGTYQIVRLIHPHMAGRIVVARRRAAVPSPRQAAATGRAQAQGDITAAVNAEVDTPHAVADPARARVLAGGGNSNRFSLLAFYRPR